jgi:hypothetical protein
MGLRYRHWQEVASSQQRPMSLRVGNLTTEDGAWKARGTELTVCTVCFHTRQGDCTVSRVRLYCGTSAKIMSDIDMTSEFLHVLNTSVDAALSRQHSHDLHGWKPGQGCTGNTHQRV